MENEEIFVEVFLSLFLSFFLKRKLLNWIICRKKQYLRNQNLKSTKGGIQQ